MANINQIVFKLIDDSGYFDSAKIQPVQLSQGTIIDSNGAVVFNIISTTPTNTKQESSTLDRYRIQVTTLSTSFTSCTTLSGQIRQALENVINQDVLSDGTIVQCSTFEGEVNGIDSGAGLDGVYYIHQDYYFWTTR